MHRREGPLGGRGRKNSIDLFLTAQCTLLGMPCHDLSSIPIGFISSSAGLTVPASSQCCWRSF